jgi:phosphoribosylamine--glycine ligase
MKILVIGSGGREHALVWKIRQSPKVETIYCAPGNAGIAEIAECVDISATDIKGLVSFALQQHIDLTVVGPESSLVEGIVDAFEAKKLRIFGPTKQAAILEGSKVFTKDFLKKYNIPTAAYKSFTSGIEAKKYLGRCTAPIVVKADGLAAGKGVIVASSIQEASDAVDLIMTEKAFGNAGNTVVIEDCLVGEEASFLAFTDGKTIKALPTSQDHKAVFDDDKGPNTGGMGAYSPAPVVSSEMTEYVIEKILKPTVSGMALEGRPYRGILYAGLMIDDKGVNVLEYNCRFGDPEAQPLLMRIETDIVDIFEACIDGTLDQLEILVDPRPTVCVVMASGGYPGQYATGKAIKGLKNAAKVDGVQVFHAGTKRAGGKIVSSGGRVLGVTAVGEDLAEAINRAYLGVSRIQFADCHYRKDIGGKALKRIAETQKKSMVGIVMGSDSDLPVMKAAADFLEKIGIAYEITVASAHRSPERATRWAKTAADRGLKVIIAGAGMAAHLAGVLSSHTDLPVIGVPLDASPLQGMDALLATVQMPPGIPVATMAIGKAGAKNAAVLAARILALHDSGLTERLCEFRREMEKEVEDKASRIAL